MSEVFRASYATHASHGPMPSHTYSAATQADAELGSEVSAALSLDSLINRLLDLVAGKET